jgi:hypothetical protein
MRDGMVGTAAGRIEINDGRRILATPWPVVSGHRPEVTAIGSAETKFENGRPCLVHEQLGRCLEKFDQPFIDRPEFKGGTTDPVGKRRTVELDPLPSIDLRLPIKRQMVGIASDDHMGDQSFGRQTAFD